MTDHPHHKVAKVAEHHQDNGLAIASFILGIISLTGFGILTGIPALITGFMSLKNPANKGLGIAGIVMGSISTVITILAVLFLLFILVIAAFSVPEYYPVEDGYDNHHESSQSQSI